MTEFAARISRVRMKSGGADVRVLHNRLNEADGEDFRGCLTRCARDIVNYATDDNPLTGYVVVGIFPNGGTSVGWRYDFDSQGAIPRTLIPSWLAEVLRRDMIAETEARNVFDEMFQWQDG